MLDSDNNKVDGGGEPATPTGYWLLTSSLIILDNVKLMVKGTSIDGDCDVLRIQVCIFRCCSAEVVDCLRLLSESNGARVSGVLGKARVAMGFTRVKLYRNLTSGGSLSKSLMV